MEKIGKNVNLKKVVVTGSLSSGKSTVCQFFKKLGAYVVSADCLLHHVYSIDTSIGRKIRRLLGDSVVTGRIIDRSRVAKQVFLKPELLAKLEDICHPYVNMMVKWYFRRIRRERLFSLFVAEIPLLFESKDPLWEWFDIIIAVESNKERTKERYVQTGGNEEQFYLREARQMPIEQKCRLADYVITNNGTIEELRIETEKLFHILHSSHS